MKLQDKVAIVTGGNRGIGKGIARKLAENGAAVAIVGRSQEALDAVVTEFSEAGFIAKGYTADVSNPEDADAVAKQVVADLGSIDILVNNAGITKDNLVPRIKEDDWDLVLDINLKGAFNFTKAVYRPMAKKRYGKIINITSVVGLMGNPGQANYSASKAGMIGLTKSNAKEFSSRNINVNAVAPGWIATEMTGELTDEQKERFLSGTPLGRIGQTDDVANAVVFLASSDSDYITGQTLNVDGGLVM
ncbi:MAG: 3-oxoacyl-[acyl-carrier-protein] reductase [Lentisphaeria bacterium]|nr:3-oxoacyl-[acyl-carrier-protein] reductase [Lentisphaeria bacterium]